MTSSGLRWFYLYFVAALLCKVALAFQISKPSVRRAGSTQLFLQLRELSRSQLRAELTGYLEKRKQLLAEQAAETGTPLQDDSDSHVFSYYELGRFGCKDLVEPVMKAGGPWEMYRLMGMKRPKKPEPVKLKEPTADGLRLSLSDTDIVKELGRADKIAQTKDARDLSPVVAEGDTVTANYHTAKEDSTSKSKTDPYETLSIDGSLRAYSVGSALLIALAFGKATPGFFELLQLDETWEASSDIVQGLGLTLGLVSIGSSVVSYVLAAEKNRNKFIWGVKGLFGGIAAISQLRGLEATPTIGSTSSDLSK